MSDDLLPVLYGEAEKNGMRSLGCRAIECFRPYHFGAVGYPFSINSIDEIWKYTECMHDGFGIVGPLDQYILGNFLQNGFTDEEFEHIKAIKTALDDLSAFIGRPCQYPTNTLFYALNQARHIRAVTPPGSLVVELGGGAGYLGALLVRMGYRYVASDISQVFYLLQSHLLARAAPKGAINLAYDRFGPNDLRALQPGQAAIIPWWRWAKPEIPAALSIDVVTSNHNFLEMHPFSLLYHLSVIRDRLSENAIGLVFEAWGDPSKNPTWTAVKAIAEKDFVLAHNDKRITCFTPKNSPYARDGVLSYPLPMPAAPTLASPSSSVPPPPKTMRHKLREKMQQYLLRGINLTTPSGPSVHPYEHMYATPTYSNDRNSLSKAILTMRGNEQKSISLTLSDYRKLLGREDLSTADERFLAYIFRDTPAARPWVVVPPIP